MKPSPGTCKTSLIVRIIVSAITIGEPALVWIAYASPPKVIGNDFLAPSNLSAKLSRGWISPIVHILNSSWWTLSRVSLNGLYKSWSTGTPIACSPGVLPTPTFRLVGTVNTWFSLYP